MSLAISSRFARRELRGGLRGFFIFLSCLALGVAAIAGVGSVRSAIEAGLAREGAALLGGDAELDFTYRFASDAEKAWMQNHSLALSEIVEFRSMAVVETANQTERGLTQVKAVDGAYPLIGQVKLSPPMPLETALAKENGLPGAVMERVLIDRLGLSIGGEFSLGSQKFRLSAEITNEPDSAASGFSLGPRTIVATKDLENSGLLAVGTLFNTKYRLDFPENPDLAALEAEARAKFENSGMRWRDSRNGAPGVARFVERLGAFLVLVGLSGLAVGGIGVAAAVRAYLAQKTNVIATLRALGAERKIIFQTYFIQIGLLSLIGISAGLILGALAPLLLSPMIEAQLPIPAEFSIFPAPLFEAALYGVLTAFIFTLWPLARAEDVRAASLFREALNGSRLLPAPKYLMAVFLAVCLLITLAAYFSGTWRLTLWTAGGISAALLVLVLAASLIKWLAGRGAALAKGRPAWRWALTSITGSQEGATSVILSLGLGLTVLASVGQIDGNLRNAITGNLPEVAPSYFFVDIQRDQMEGYSKRLDDDPSVSRVDSAPMLRGVITKINGKPAREVAGDHWVIEGDRGVTYSDKPDRRTRITKGEWWPENYSGPPLISFAAEEAEEIGLELGDTLTINVLGRDITGTISSFREVDFSTAGISFIMSMNPAALRGAPHSFISTVYAKPEAEAAILRDLASTYPNITAIRVRDAIERIADALTGLAAAVSYGAGATLLTGFLVLIGAAAAGTKARTYEAAILKTLGATRGRILFSFALRAALMGLAAGTVALFAGITGGWAVSTYIMEIEYNVIWPSALWIVVGGVIAVLCSSLMFAWQPLGARPAQILRARE